MELSEFEETVAKESDLLDAGALEDFLADKPRFLRRDFSREAGELHMALHSVHSSLERWNEVGLTALVSAWEEQSIKITEFREESVRRKKSLATVLRLFSSEHLIGAAVDVERVKADSRGMIESFKADYDYLSNSLKFAEAAFFSTYKILHDVTDPCSIFEQCQEVCLHAQDALKDAQEQLVVAEEMLSEQGTSNSQYRDGEEDREEVATLQKTIADLQQSLQEERIAVRTRLEGELRGREYEMRSTFEQQQMQLQKQMDDALSRKDLEISSLASSLDVAAHQQLESSERDRGLDAERRKRLDLEEKFRGTLTDLGDAQKHCADLRAKLEESAGVLKRREDELAVQHRSHESRAASLENTLGAYKSRLERLEGELRARPPLDLTSFVQKTGLGSDILPPGGEQPSWEALEALLLQSVRKINGEAADSRVKEQEAARRLLQLEEETTALRARVTKDAAAAAVLEADLLETTRALESSRALLKCYAGKGGESAAVTPAKSRPAEKRQGAPAAYSPGQSKPVTPSRRGTADNDELEEGSGGRGAALALLGPSVDGEIDGPDRMLAAVQAQRDRYMRSALEHEGELASLRDSFERLQDEQHVLRAENLELFRRLRVLRVSAKDGAAPRAGRGRRSAVEEGLHDAAYSRDPLDAKYGGLYEGQIDPFRVQELDRQAVLSKLNAFERGLAQAMRLLAADPLARYALLMYLLLVHFFACGYVIQVLNPQLIEEVDAGLKRRWAEQALGGEEHPDV